MIRFGSASAALLIAASWTFAADALTEGAWRLNQHSTPSSELRQCVFKVEMKDGKPAVTVADARMMPAVGKGKNPQKLAVKVNSVEVKGSAVRMSLDIGAVKNSFEGTVDPKDPKIIRGSLQTERGVSRASLVQQDGEKLAPLAAADRPKLPEPFAEANRLMLVPAQLQRQAQMTSDVNERGELLAKAKAARAEADAKLPDLYRQTASKHSDSPFAVDAADRLITMAGRIKASNEEVKSWVKLISSDAAKYGPRMERFAALELAEDLVALKGLETIALELATKAADGLSDSDPLSVQSRTLSPLVAALKANGKSQEAKVAEERWAKVEAAMDQEYMKTVPPFTPTKFGGRKDKEAKRVAVMELFTGAQCPPCVAADVAFDALEKAYDPADLILIQYHMHIPGPDPLTNPSSIARWDYYREKFPMDITGTPSTLFNGKRGGGSGGGMAAAESKFMTYSKVIDPLLEEKTTITIGGSAKLNGDKVTVDVNVDGVKEPGKNIKLRIVLIEDSVKYVGSNGLRFHHHVVRDIPDAKDGYPIMEKSMKTSKTIDLAEVKKGLTKYLSDFAATRPFPNSSRPMDLKHLKVIALVQDDESLEILNAAQFDVK